MKKIVMARSNPVEPDSRVEKEANSLANAGYEVILLAWDRTANYRCKSDWKQLKDHRVRRISFGAKAAYGAGMKSILSYLRFQISLLIWLMVNRNNYDICHLCDFDTAFTGSNICRLLRKKYVFDIFDYLSTDARSFSQRVLKRMEDGIINHSNATIICTEDRKKQIQDARPQKLVVIHNTPNMVQFAPVLSETVAIKVAYVGILQDYRLLLELGEYFKGRRDVELHIGGFGKYEKYFEELAREYDNIVWYGRLPYEKTLELEHSCDIMLAIYDPQIGNHRFAAPNKFYESLMLGRPVIMVRGTGMSDLVEKYDIGELIDYSVNGFDHGLNALIARRSEWTAMGKRMQRLYEDFYSWNVMEKRLVDLYRDL